MTDFLKRKLKQLGKLAREKMPSKKAIFLFVFLTVVSLVLALPAKAQFSAAEVGRGLMQGVANVALALAELCIRLSVFFLQFFISLAQWNNYIDVPIVMLGWTMVRDVANMFFVVIFLIIAIGTILGLEQYQWNKTLVKLVLAAVFINFSNLICGIFIDVAHVFTITFVNAISATAGGNLINMFKLDKIFKLTTDTTPLGAGGVAAGGDTKIDLRLLAASVAAFLFAGLAMITIAVYTIIMLYRVIILWVLVILSPIAYIASVLPQSQSYAKEWWDEFSRYVLVAPMMVFFLWLAFATLGAGNVAQDMGLKVAMSTTVNEGSYTTEELGGEAAVSLSEITQWANLANILIPICLLWVGMERVQKMGVRGGDMVSSGMNLFKSAATMATGYAAGRWMVKKGWEGAKKGTGAVAKFAAWEMPLIGGRKWAMRFKNVGNDISTWAQGSGKRLEDQGFIQRGVSFFARRRAFEDSYAELKATRAKVAHDVNDESSSSHTVGDDLRKMSGRLVTIKARKSERDAAAFAEGAEEEAGKTRQQHRFWGRVDENGKRQEGLWSLHTVAKVLGITTTADRGKEEGTQAHAISRKALEKEYFEKRKKKKLDEARNDLLGKRGLGIEGREGAQHKLEVIVKAQQALDDTLVIPGERDRLATLDDRKKALGLRQEEITTQFKDREKQELETSRDLSGKVGEIVAPYMDAQAGLSAFDEWQKEKQRIEGLIANQDAKIKPGEVRIAELQTQIASETDDGKKAKLVKQMEKQQAEVDAAKAQKKEGEDALKTVNESLEGKERNKLAQATEEERQKAIKKLEESGLMDTVKDLSPDIKLYGEAKDASGKPVMDPAVLAKSLSDNIANRQKQITREREVVLEQAFKDSQVDEAQTDLDKYHKSEEYKKATSGDEYRKKKAAVDEAKAKMWKPVEEGGMAEANDVGVRWVLSKSESATTEEILKQTEADLEHTASETDLVKHHIAMEEIAKMGAEGAKKFVEEIRKAKIAEAMKKGADAFKKAVEDAAKGLAVDFKKLDDPAARLSYANVSANYAEDRSSTARKTVEDLADTAYAGERYGMDTPATAFKALIKKRMEDSFAGVEREQGVVIALGSLQKLLGIKDRGGDLDPDQKAQMMANIQYLIKNAWSDDLMARIVRIVNDRKSMTGQGRQDAEMLKKIFVDRLKWGKVGDGDMIKINHSSGERTNDLHRLIGYGGDIDMLQSENVVLHAMRGADGKTEVRGYFDAAEKVADAIKQALPNTTDFKNVNDSQWTAIAKNMGMTHKTAGEEVKAFANKFAVGTDSATEAMQRFKSGIQDFGEANELLADYKNLALQVAHLDDGGHTYFDMQEKLARGQLADKARDFINSDWRKVDVRERVRRLKTHSNSKMDEDYGTGSFVDRSSFAETYEGGINKPILQSGDARNMQLITKRAAGEKAVKNEKGQLLVGHKGSELLTGTYGEKRYGNLSEEQRNKLAMKDIARDWAQYLDLHPEVLLAYLGQDSGVKFEDAIAGKLNIVIGEGTSFRTEITKVEELIGWIKKTQGTLDEFNKDTEEYYDEATAHFVDMNKRGLAITRQVQSNKGKGGGQSSTEKEEEEDRAVHDQY